jgi:Fic family protein
VLACSAAHDPPATTSDRAGQFEPQLALDRPTLRLLDLANQAVGDVEETANYLVALGHGVDSVTTGRLPISSRLLREIHGLLLGGVRGGDKAPGEFRRVQNWLGGARPADARFVPPQPQEIAGAIADLERFIHDEDDGLALLVKAALAHAQFESIHPFLDGNGRVGRLLITLMLRPAAADSHAR